MDNDIIKYCKISERDGEWINQFIKQNWGSEKIVVHFDVYYPSKLDGFIAELNEHKSGLVTYIINNEYCEIITLNSVLENRGIGKGLVQLVIDKAKTERCKRVFLTTTNDNNRAINFYRRLGFKVSNVFKDAVVKSRKIKPEIPELGKNGIPIKDEIEMTLTI